MHKIIVSTAAKADIEHLVENIVDYTGFVESGVRLHNDFMDKINAIAYMPEALGRLRPEPNTRESFVRGYRIVYEIQPNVIYIKTIIHSRRLYPRP